MSKAENTKKRIIEKSKDLFFKFNFSKVSIDDIASNLSMSKKTIYKYFPSKEEILRNVIALLTSKIENQAKSIVESTELDYTSKLKRMFRFMGKQTTILNSALVKEIQKKFPDIWEEITKFRKEKVRKYMLVLLNEGVEKGIFRKDIDLDLIIFLYINMAVNMITPEFLETTTLSTSEVFENIINILFEGVLTSHGRELTESIIRQ